MNWKVKLERYVEDIKSTLTYEIPKDWSVLLTSMDDVDVEYHQSIIAGVHKHLQNEFGQTGFEPIELIPPAGYMYED